MKPTDEYVLDWNGKPITQEEALQRLYNGGEHGWSTFFMMPTTAALPSSGEQSPFKEETMPRWMPEWFEETYTIRCGWLPGCNRMVQAATKRKRNSGMLGTTFTRVHEDGWAWNEGWLCPKCAKKKVR